MPGEWTHLRSRYRARRPGSIGAAAQPTLVVRDLKHGTAAHGTVGLFVDNGTDGHFRNLTIRPR